MNFILFFINYNYLFFMREKILIIFIRNQKIEFSSLDNLKLNCGLKNYFEIKFRYNINISLL